MTGPVLSTIKKTSTASWPRFWPSAAIAAVSALGGLLLRDVPLAGLVCFALAAGGIYYVTNHPA